jgi:hypothetical protein
MDSSTLQTPYAAAVCRQKKLAAASHAGTVAAPKPVAKVTNPRPAQTAAATTLSDPSVVGKYQLILNPNGKTWPCMLFYDRIIR